MTFQHTEPKKKRKKNTKNEKNMKENYGKIKWNQENRKQKMTRKNSR